MKKEEIILGITIMLILIMSINVIMAASGDESVLSTGISPKITINQTGEKKNQTDPNADKNGNTNQPANNAPTTPDTNTETQTTTTTSSGGGCGGGGGGGGSSSSSSSSSTTKTITNKSTTQEAGNTSVTLKIIPNNSKEKSTQENISQETSSGITGAVIGSSLTNKLKIPFILTISVLIIVLIALLIYMHKIKKSEFAKP